MTRVIGLLTVGQSPRPDGLTADVRAVLGEGFRVVERGALDGLAPAEIESMFPGDGDDVIITLLADGTSVRVAKARLLDLIQARVTALEEEDGVDLTLVLCTGRFPAFSHCRPLLRPQQALYAAAIALADGGRVGSMTPLDRQVPQARDKWRTMGVPDAVVVAADPYAADAPAGVRQAAAAAAAQGAAILFMDCFGYDLTMKRAARQAFPGPVLLARSLAARLAAEVAV